MNKSDMTDDERAVYNALVQSEWRQQREVFERTENIPMAEVGDILVRLARHDIIQSDGQRVPTGWRLPKDGPEKPPVAGVVRSRVGLCNSG